MNENDVLNRPIEHLTYNEPQHPAQQTATISLYYRLIIAHIICLSITCILTVINIMQTSHVSELVRAEKQDTISYLQDAERALDRKMELQIKMMRLEIAEELEKKSGKNLGSKL